MGKMVYSAERIAIPHKDLVTLRQQGKLNLGIDQGVARKLEALGIHPPGTAIGALWVYRGAALAIAALGLYWAYTSAWWWGVLGIIAMGVILSANKTGHRENLLDAAMQDEMFYERVRELNGWRYQIDEDAAKGYLY